MWPAHSHRLQSPALWRTTAKLELADRAHRDVMQPKHLRVDQDVKQVKCVAHRKYLIKNAVTTHKHLCQDSLGIASLLIVVLPHLKHIAENVISPLWEAPAVALKMRKPFMMHATQPPAIHKLTTSTHNDNSDHDNRIKYRMFTHWLPPLRNYN